MPRKDVFISYAGPDRPWAEWAAGVLERAGYRVELDIWDWAVGANASLAMSDALAGADRVLVLYSRAYFERARFTTAEWTAVLAARPDERGAHRLVPIRIEDVQPPPILAPLVFRDVFDQTPERAEELLVTAVAGAPHPREPKPYPGRARRPRDVPAPASGGAPAAYPGRDATAPAESLLAAANGLIIDMVDRGAFAQARQLGEEALARGREVLGDDHPGTLAIANNLAVALRCLGAHREARDLAADTADRMRETLGADHPDTRGAEANLAAAQRLLDGAGLA